MLVSIACPYLFRIFIAPTYQSVKWKRDTMYSIEHAEIAGSINLSI